MKVNVNNVLINTCYKMIIFVKLLKMVVFNIIFLIIKPVTPVILVMNYLLINNVLNVIFQIYIIIMYVINVKLKIVIFVRLILLKINLLVKLVHRIQI